LLAFLPRWTRVEFFPADFQFFFDDGLDDSIAEINVLLFELCDLAVQLIEERLQAHHYFPAP
jgi:hypothetical protein